MHLSEQIKNNTILTLISGSFVLQLVVLLVALVYRFNTNVNPLEQLAQASSGLKHDANHIITEGKLVPNTEGTAPIEAKDKVTKYKISSGDTLSKIWSKFSSVSGGGVKAADAFKAAKIPASSLRVGDEVNLTISKNDITEFSMKLPEGKAIRLVGNSLEGYKAELTTSEIISKERTVSYNIYNSFSESAREVNVPVDIIDDLVDLYSGRIDFSRDIQPGDSFTVIYEERTTADGERLAPGKIKAISIETNSKLMVAIQHLGKDGVWRYFNESGELLGNSFLRYPVKFSRISSIFTKARFHPVLKINRPHNGVDFAAPTGTPVRTIGDGVVEYAGYAAGTGNMIKIKHNDKYSTAYLHLSKISAGIKKGAHIARGEVIGAVGSTGLSTAPHLHFAMYEKEKFINPMTANLPVTAAKENSIPKTLLASTLNVLKQQHELVRIASLMGLTKSAQS